MPAPTPIRGGALARGILSSGYLGVSLFFVLSGFILAYNYLDATGERRVDRAAFWNARFARIYPAYALSLLVAFPTVWRWAVAKLAEAPLAVAAGKVLAVAVLNTSLLQAWLAQTVPPWNAPGWSLSVEALFYGLFPFLGPTLAALGARRPVRTLAALWVAGLVVPSLYTLAARRPHLSPLDGTEPTMVLTAISYFPLLHLPEFLLGVVVGKLFLAYDATVHDRADRARARWGVVADCAILAYPALLAATPALPYPLLHNGLLAPVFALIIFALAAGDGAASRVLSWAPLLLLGEASYGLYLFHLPLLSRVREVGAAVGASWDRWWQPVVVAAVASLALSVAVLKLVEEPARRSVRRRLDALVSRTRAARVDTVRPATE